MIRRSVQVALACALLLACARAQAATPPPSPPHGPAVAVALAYARAAGSGDYARAYGLLSHDMQRYFGNLNNYASVWQAEHFGASDVKALRLTEAKGTYLVTVQENVTYLNHGTQAQGHGKLTLGYLVVHESGAYRVVDSGHPYRSFVPQDCVLDRSGVRVIVRELAFYPRRIELTLTFENGGAGFITFLPYGRTLLRDQFSAYHPLVTRNWLLTDRRLFLGLRLAPDARYTGQIDFLTSGRLDDRERTFALTVAPALPEGAERPEEFALPPIAVAAP